MSRTPTVGRVVHYRLSANDVLRINDCRVRSNGALRGNPVSEGEPVPLHVVKIWPNEYAMGNVSLIDSMGVSWPFDGTDGINGQALLDGNDSIWVCSAGQGDGPGQWRWPTQLGGSD